MKRLCHETNPKNRLSCFASRLQAAFVNYGAKVAKAFAREVALLPVRFQFHLVETFEHVGQGFQVVLEC